MIVTGSRLRHIGWFVALAVCFALFMALKFRVDAVKSEVRLAEREVVALKNDKTLLETEFETRSNQQQLARWNTVDFGYGAPKAEQFFENERQLAVLGTPRGLNAPDPIRVARAPEEEDGIFPAMVSPMTGQPAGAAKPKTAGRQAGVKQAAAQPGLALADRLSNPDTFDAPAADDSE